jgi:hypothetical protein
MGSTYKTPPPSQKQTPSKSEFICDANLKYLFKKKLKYIIRTSWAQELVKMKL